MKMNSLVVAVIIAVVVICSFGSAQSQEASRDSYIEWLRADLRADRVAIITDAMQFTDKESKAFWPLYRQYEAEVAGVNDQRVAVVKLYADKYPNLSDADANTLIEKSLSFEERRAAVTKKYANEFLKAGLSPVTVARFLQLEHRLNLAVDAELAYEIPWVEQSNHKKSNP